MLFSIVPIYILTLLLIKTKNKIMRTFKITIGKKVRGFNFYLFNVPNLKNATIEKVYFIQVPFFSVALFMGYKSV